MARIGTRMSVYFPGLSMIALTAGGMDVDADGTGAAVGVDPSVCCLAHRSFSNPGKVISRSSLINAGESCGPLPGCNCLSFIFNSARSLFRTSRPQSQYAYAY